MTYNVFSGTLNSAQSINQSVVVIKLQLTFADFAMERTATW